MNDPREEIEMQFRKNGKKPDDMGRSFGADRDEPTTKESGGN